MSDTSEKFIVYNKENPGKIGRRWRICLLATICVLGVVVLAASIACHMHCPRDKSKIVYEEGQLKRVVAQKPPPPPTPAKAAEVPCQDGDIDCSPTESTKMRKGRRKDRRPRRNL